MCGIWFYINKNNNKKHFYDSFKKIKHRGPDKSSYIELSNFVIGFHRLAIMDTSSNGDQPFVYEHNGHTIYTLCNAEIYNYDKIIRDFNLTPKSHSDCEVIPLLYINYGFSTLINTLNGEFAFIICDIDNTNNNYDIYVVRDQFGVRPLFWSEDENGIYFSSEMKGIHDMTNGIITPFKPGSYININTDNKIKIIDYYNYIYYERINGIDSLLDDLRNKFIDCVKKRLKTDRPFGCLLSGGLDSSLVSAVAAKNINMKLKTFSIGMENATDLLYALKVANHINSDHTEIIIKPEDALNAIPYVIYATETYDITTIRASVPQFLLAKYISENTNIKVILNGDYSDEMCGSYMYFMNAPDEKSYHDECVRLLKEIYLYDALRVDRTISYHGLEARMPFSDTELIEFYLQLPPKLRMPRPSQILNFDKKIEKPLLREAFANTNYLPDCVLKRCKEGFSDGCSSKTKSWFEIIQDYANNIISDDEFNNHNYVFNPPHNKEAYYYRKIFEKYYPNRENVIPHMWLPSWCGDIKEPSARILPVYWN